MTSLFAHDALLPNGWAKDVRIEIDSSGNIVIAKAGSIPGNGAALAGPVLPGMANLHSHAFQRAMAGLTEVRGAPDDDFWSWRELMYRFVQRLTPEQAQAVAKHLYIEMLKHGYTAVGEFHYVHNDPEGRPYADPSEMLLRHLAAAKEAGIAITLLPSPHRTLAKSAVLSGSGKIPRGVRTCHVSVPRKISSTRTPPSTLPITAPGTVFAGSFASRPSVP